MPNINSYIKVKNLGGTFDTIFPISKSENIIVDGSDKRLSTKLSEIDSALLTFILSSEKGVANGVATLDADGLVPLAQLPAGVKEVRVVDDITARDAITPKFSGLSVFVKDATADSTVTSGGAYYIYDGSVWTKTAEAESLDVVLQWANIQGTPTTLAGYGITDAVNVSEVVTVATPNKILKLNEAGKLVADVIGDLTGNADTASKLLSAVTISTSGDATGSTSFDGSGNVDIELTLANSGVTAGTYTKVTVDSKGRVTTGDSLIADDIPALDWSKITTGTPTTLAGYGITDALNLAGGTLTGFLTLHADPTQDLHAVTKRYVDMGLQGLAPKAAVRVATTTDVTRAGLSTIDGIAVAAGNRILVKDQRVARFNGVYEVTENSGSVDVGIEDNFTYTSGNDLSTSLSYATVTSLIAVDDTLNIITPTDGTQQKVVQAITDDGVNGTTITFTTSFLHTETTEIIVTKTLSGQSNVWARTADFDGSPEGEIKGGEFFFVQEGSLNGDMGFVCVTNSPISIGTDPVNFTQFSGAGQITVGVGLGQNGNQLYLANTAVTPGTYTKVTVDQQGRITSGDTLIESDIPDISWTKILNRPTSAVADIDDAVTKRHAHSNFSVLEAFSDVSGRPAYNSEELAYKSESNNIAVSETEPTTLPTNGIWFQSVV